MKRHDTPNSPNKTHFMVELSPAFMQLANTKDITFRLFKELSAILNNKKGAVKK